MVTQDKNKGVRSKYTSSEILLLENMRNRYWTNTSCRYYLHSWSSIKIKRVIKKITFFLMKYILIHKCPTSQDPGPTIHDGLAPRSHSWPNIQKDHTHLGLEALEESSRQASALDPGFSGELRAAADSAPANGMLSGGVACCCAVGWTTLPAHKLLCLIWQANAFTYLPL